MKNNKSVIMMIEELARVNQAYFQAICKEYSIGHAQIKTLIYIAKNKGVSQQEISDYFDLDKSSLTSQLNLLETNGYIEKKVSEDDARKYELKISDKAKKILGPLKKAKMIRMEALFDDFSDKDKKQLSNYLEKMRDNVKK